MEFIKDPTAKRRARGPGGQEDVAPEYRVRARFYAIRQVDGEPAYDWYRRVRAAAVPCRFGGPDRQAAAVADKFVTGLRPGPVADRLLGERADRSPEDLLAVAVAAEELARGPRRAVAGADRVASSSSSSSATAGAPGRASTADAGAAGDRRDALIDELREGLKLYRYSSGGYARPQRVSGSGGGGGGDGDDGDDDDDGGGATRRCAPPPFSRTVRNA